MFTSQLRSKARVRTELAAALSKALREGELTVEYQPIFSAVSERAEAAEALVRWNHPTKGRIEAADFADIAGVELLTIDDDTTVRGFTQELRWNQAYYRLAGGL